MSKILVILTTFVFYSFVEAQVLPPSNYKPAQFNYQPLQLERFAKPLAQKQAKYDKNYEYLQSLINWINEIKSEVTEETLNSYLDEYYIVLRSYEKKDLSAMTRELKQVENAISEEIEDYNKRLSRQNDPRKYWRKANYAYEMNDFHTALENYNSVIKSLPEFTDAHYYRGLTHYALGNYSSSITDFNNFIKEEKGVSEGYLFRGLSHFKISNYQMALLDLNKSIDLDPEDPFSFYSRGVIFTEINQYDKAIDDYKQAIKLAPDFSKAYNKIARIKMIQEQFIQALVFADQSLKFDDTNSHTYETRAEVKFYLKDYEGCLKDASQSTLIDSTNDNSYLIKGRALYRMGKKSKACNEWNKAVELGNVDALEFIGQYCY